MDDKEKAEFDLKLAEMKKAGLVKEAKRLEKQPFKTMCEVINQDTIDELRGWKEPQTAYILFESLVRKLTPDGAVLAHSLFTMNVEDRPEQEHKLYHYIRKGYRPIHMANFPEVNDPNPRRAAKAKLHLGFDKINPWQEMARLVRIQMGKDNQHVDLIKEKKGLEAKLDEARAEIAALKGNKKAVKSENLNA